MKDTQDDKMVCLYCSLKERDDIHILVYEWLVINNKDEIGTSAFLEPECFYQEVKGFKRLFLLSEEEIKERKIGEKLMEALIEFYKK
jgi:hypothetical protein